jgi:hypothetical protein
MFSPSQFRQLRPRTRQFKDLYPVNPEHSLGCNPGCSPEYSLFRSTPINPPAWLLNKDSRRAFNPSTLLAISRTTGDCLIESVSLAKASPAPLMGLPGPAIERITEHGRQSSQS